MPKLPRTDAGLEVLIGGVDDTLEVGYLHAGAAASRSVARLRVRRYFDGYPSMLAGDEPDRGDGTGWVLAPRLLITNHHVINARTPYEPAASSRTSHCRARPSKRFSTTSAPAPLRCRSSRPAA